MRLVEIGENTGTCSVRIDDVSELDPSWFPKGDETIMLTAGASAPEDLVSEICRYFVDGYEATLHVADISEETVEFGLPLTLKRLMESHGVDHKDRRITIDAPTITSDEYGTVAVPLTISTDRS